MSITRFIENAIMTLRDALAMKATERQRRLADRLVAELYYLANTPSAEPQLDFWRNTCRELCASAQSDDPMKFMQWPAITGTMSFGTTRVSRDIYGFLKRSPRWAFWSRMIRHPHFGSGRPFLPNLRTNAVTVQHASHLEMFEQRTGQSLLDADCIVDLGAGYGSMCALARRIGYKGQYVIFDQPPVLALQRYYLGLNSIAADYDKSAVSLCQSIAEVRKIAGQFENVSLISTWALSEMPIELRIQAEPLIASASKVILAYQDNFEGVRNRQYFREMASRIDRPWQHFEIAFYPSNYYVLTGGAA